MVTRICIICKRNLPIDHFHRNKRQHGGCEYFCKECNVVRMRKWREKNRSRMNEIVYASMARYPDRCRARAIANQHYTEAQNCSIEDCENAGERHHDDYSKPKEIRWLCKEHHKGLHRVYK